MSVSHVHNIPELNNILKAEDKLTVIDFHATWCPPCIAFGPIFESYPDQYPNVQFVKCDVDAAKAVAKAYGITAMPTFIFVKGGNKVDAVRGADKYAVERAIHKHSPKSEDDDE